MSPLQTGSIPGVKGLAVGIVLGMLVGTSVGLAVAATTPYSGPLTGCLKPGGANSPGRTANGAVRPDYPLSARVPER